MRIPLTIAADYLPEWRVTEGLRELVQNWLDADGHRHGAPEFSGGRLVLPNPDAVLHREALLLGVTSKANRDEMRGQFGEGLKVGTLALVRAGRRVAIEAGGERWEASIENAPEFGGRRVLVWSVEPSETPHVVVEVSGLTPEEWAEAGALFRDLTEDAHVDTWAGALLTDPSARGAIFVKGIRIATDDGLAWGYDLKNAAVDRDRRLVRDFELGWEAGNVLAAAMLAGTVTSTAVLDALVSAAKDCSQFEYAAVLDDNALALLVAAFRARHGDDAIPVADADQKHRLDHLGKNGVIVPVQAARMFARSFGSFEDIVREALNEVVARHTDLTDDEQATLGWAIDEVRAVTGICASHLHVEVVTYRDPGTLGRFVGGHIEIARFVLADRYETLATLIHEVAHFLGADGEAKHASAIEQVWTALARRWLVGRQHLGDLVVDAHGPRLPVLSVAS